MSRRRVPVFSLLLVTLLLACVVPAMPSDPDSIFVSPEERALVDRTHGLSHRFEFDEALAAAEEAVTLFPDGPQSHMTRVHVLYSMNRLPDALPLIKARLEKSADDFVAQLSLAYVHSLSRNKAAAEEALAEALRLRPDSPEARHIEVILARIDPEKESRADSLAEKLRRDHPDYARAYMSEASWLLETDASERKIQAVLDAALALPVPPAGAFEMLDRLREREDIWYDPETALPLFDRALEIDPSRMDLILERADRFRRLGRLEEAREAIQRVVEEAPRFGEARVALADLLMDLHRHDEALAVLNYGAEEGAEGMPYQPWYLPRAYRLRADALHLAGRHDEAAAELQWMIERFAALGSAQEARRRMVSLLGRDKDATVRILDNVPFLTQKGNYCGPATLSMILGFWGVERSQDAIAGDIYTGVVGTAPQVIGEYAGLQGFETATFEGSVDGWKRLIDGGVPILWLARVPGRGWHYILIVGYDDVFRQFVVHNPHQSTEGRVDYDEIRPKGWPIPNLIRSMAVAPAGSEEARVVAELRPTPRLQAVNLAIYLSTGSNLFKGLWPAAAVNLCVAAALAFALLAMMRAMVYPSLGWSGPVFAAAVLSAVGGLNWLIAATRVSQAVSILIALYLTWASLVPLFLLCLALRRLSHDWFHPRELFALAALVFLSWAARGLIDDGHWQDRVPLMLLLLGFAGVLAGRRRTAGAIQRARLGPWCASADSRNRIGNAAAGEDVVETLLRPHARPESRRGGSYAALMALIEARLARLDAEGALALIGLLRSGRRRWNAPARDTFDLLEAAAWVAGELGRERAGEGRAERRKANGGPKGEADSEPATTRSLDSISDSNSRTPDFESRSPTLESPVSDVKSQISTFEFLLLRRDFAGSRFAASGFEGTKSAVSDSRVSESTVTGSGGSGSGDALEVLRRLASAKTADSAVGAVARALLAFSRFCLCSERPSEEKEAEAARALDEARAFCSSLRQWPRLPAVPRIAHQALPHLLIRCLPLLVAAAERGRRGARRAEPEAEGSATGLGARVAAAAVAEVLGRASRVSEYPASLPPGPGGGARANGRGEAAEECE